MVRPYLSIVFLSCAGCKGLAIPLPSSPGGPAYEIRTDRLGTGEQAVVPRSDLTHWEGEPLDLRR